MMEMEHSNAPTTVTINDMKAENDALLQLMEEAMQLSRNMHDKIANVIQARRASVKGYEGKLRTLKNELHQTQRKSYV